MLDRRDLLRSTSGLAVAAVVAGCAGDGTDGGDGSGGDGDGNDGDSGGDGGDGGDGDGGGRYGDGDGDGTDDSDADDGDAGESDGGSTTEASETTTGSDADETDGGQSSREAYPDYNWDNLDGESAQEATTVTMTGFGYDPVVARVPAGEAISFPNEDQAPHTVTIPAVGIDEEVGGGEETTVTVEESGTYDYVCRFHPPDMLGRLVVE